MASRRDSVHNRALNAAIELHDSRLGSISFQDGSVVVRLVPAFVHRSVSKPGFDDGVCEAQDCALVFEEGDVEGLVGEIPVYILEGAFQVGAEVHANMIGLPCESVGSPVALTLRLEDDYRKIVVSGSSLGVELVGEVRFTEPFRR